jgi:DedD protein
MNRQLKERIVGATVIVALGIVIIPWLLDGPAQSPQSVEQRLELPRAEGGGRTYTIPLDPAAGRPVQVSGSEPEPAASAPPAGTIQRPALEQDTPPRASTRAAEQPSQPPPRPSPAPAPSATPPSPPAAAGAAAETGWTVQVGSFSQADNADALRQRLAGQGFDAFVSRVATDAGTMHRVRVGPVPERAAADQLLARLRAAGHAGARVVRAED